MIARELKEKLRSRQTQIGTFVKLADPTALEVLGLAGMDFAIIDTEHAPCDQMLLLDMIRAADSVGPVSYTHLDVYKRQILNF